ncbi:DUF4809 family protein [Enterococcus raffinosus]|nr:DUF4809 family protein [Enterococcus raffinosus]
MNEKAIITSKERITEGGCNACGFVKCITYTIHFEDGRNAALDVLDLPSLVRTIALKKGWREWVEIIGIGEERVHLVKNSQVVSMDETNHEICYTKERSRIESPKQFEDKNLLFKQVNEILETIFGIEGYLIKLRKKKCLSN